MAAESSQTQEMTAVGGSGGPGETEGGKKRIASDARGSWGVSEGGWPMPVLFGKREAPRKTVPEENDPPKDPTAIERANLLNMVKLSIKSLIESSYQVGRTLDKDFAPLQQFLIVMEHVLKHGLKAKKSILSTNKHVWGPLEAVEKLEPEATEINNSVRELPQIKTYPGKARAWLRLAMMQKRLADYVKTLVEKKDVMGEFYEPFALLMEEEGMVLAGLLVGLNVIDCNFCVKEDDFDSQLGVIDFSMYLKDPGNYTDRSPGEASRTDSNSSQANLTAVLDQKNYVEELNRHLNATVTNLQARIENLERDNSSLSEKLAMANNRVLQLQEEGDKLQTENTRIKGDLEKKLVQKKVSFAGSENPGDVERADTSAKLEDKDVEKELELQISMKQEMEMAMKLLEKDIHEKQDMIVGLRKQLDDIKAINIDMYKKFQAAEGSLKHKTEMLVKLEEKCTQMSQTIKDIEQRLKQAEREKMGAEEAARRLGKQLVDKDTKRAAVETDLKIEREWRTALQQDIEKQKEVIQELQTELQQMEAVKKEFQSLQEAHEQLKQTCEDQEKTLAEMGHKLSESKLKMEDMKEALKDELKFNQDKVWTDDKDVTDCRQCEKQFSVSRRKHHCRNCGGIFCNDCSDNKMPLPSSAKPVRVCDQCHTKLLERYSAVVD
ncbi:PREDICTED: RUN and FYVE domain-containing protein 2-like isoform X5 [Branchiostoma belcheri]|uniref:RUN and FYVE domain-containing protein 2-like isoform X5 n=1 Tax=Branchiostoma belcheri TaxID=7741 RepID=A0A6P4ZY30_BRABE|nr:PREDICTED: RUN and FYVE domain-containing protein 2-like isoform X5 [Branchiostoma belcheri]